VYCRTGLLACPLGIALLLSAAGCARSNTKPELQHFAILRFENLSADSNEDWMGRALSEVLSAELSGAPGLAVISTAQLRAFDRTLGVRPISAPGISTERTDALAAGADRLGYGDYSVRGGRLSVSLSIEDAHTGRMVKTVSVSAAANDVLGAATDLARQISVRTAPYPTHNSDCLEAYAEALESRNLPDTAANLGRAIAADPDFGPPYRMLAELDAQRGDKAAAMTVLNQAMARGDAIAPIERARIAVVDADLQADAAAKQAALTELAKLEPGNSNAWQTLAVLAMSRHSYKQAEDAYRRALEIAPENASLLNELGYSAAYAGDFEAGFAALHRYQQLRPNDANAIDSLGDLNFLAGHLREAEELYLQANKKDPNFLPTGPGGDLFKAAMARAMTGDIAPADDLDRQFAEVRAAGHDPNAPFRPLQWLWLTGRRTQAYKELQSLARASEAGSQPLVASHAYAELAIWSLISGERATAAEMAQKAAALATPPAATPALIARFLSQPSAPAEEWRSRADRFAADPAQGAVKDQMLAYALLLDGKVKAAAEPLQRLYNASGIAVNEEGLPVLLAWTLLESGDAAAAAPLLKLNPVPPGAGVSTFMPLYFPRVFELRAQVAAKAGKADEARQNLDLFRKLSGK